MNNKDNVAHRAFLNVQNSHIMKRKLLLTIGGVLLLLIVTNPSITAFKAYRGRDSYDGLKRPLNLFVYSVYKDHGAEFIGLLENFIRVNQNDNQSNITVNLPGVTTLEPDSTIKDTTIKLSIPQFATKIKAKYPEYKNINDTLLVEKIIEKYPVYKESVDL